MVKNKNNYDNKKIKYTFSLLAFRGANCWQCSSSNNNSNNDINNSDNNNNND